MTKRKFLALCKVKRIKLDPIRNIPLENYKELTGRFIYDCEFGNKNWKIPKGCIGRSTEMCCCTNCAKKIGFFRKIRDFKSTAEEYASKFDLNTGFWRSGSGCILPQRLRSTTCVSFICHTILEQFERKNSNDVVEFMKLLEIYDSVSDNRMKRLKKLYIAIKYGKGIAIKYWKGVM